MSIEALAQRVMRRCDQLASYSEESGLLMRRFATPPMQLVNQQVARWMQEAGLRSWQDSIGNLIGRYEAQEGGTTTLMLGSHLDTVRDAGKYDGPLGVLIALACIELFHERGECLPFALELYAFAEEEGLRYHTSYLGSKVVAGILEPEILALRDPDGISVAEAIRQFGGNPDALQASKRKSEDLLGYCEVHIEQGPILEALDKPVGVVTAITGLSRIAISIKGQAGHAGTTPMHMRHDALCAAAEFVLNCEEIAKAHPGLVATVGQLLVEPGVSNVIPGKVTLSLDVRHMDDEVRARELDRIYQQLQQSGQKRGVTIEWRVMQEHAAVPCDEGLMAHLKQAIATQGISVHSLPSGAGHDGAALSSLTRIAMLFVRCAGGISHNPAEAVNVEDVAVAIRVMEQFLQLLAKE
jgi:allantoate deiminase